MRIWLNNEQSKVNFVYCLFTIPLFFVSSDKYIVLVFLAYGLFKVAVVLDFSECFDQTNTLRISTSYARCLANEHRQLFPRPTSEKKETSDHGAHGNHR
jgi:hypothetical protein